MNRYVSIALIAMAASFAAAGASAPALPREYVDTTLPVRAGTVLEVSASCSDLQAKIDAARAGDTVAIPPEATCTGSYILRAKPEASGWIFVQSSAAGRLPGPGRRIAPEHAPLLPKIVAAGAPAIRTEPGAHHYRLIGLEITAPQDAIVNDLVTLGDGSSAQSTLAQVPTDIVVDRCYIHGSAHQKIKRGISLQSARTAVINSYFSELHTTAQDSQAIGGWNGPGPYKIANNFLSASTENVMFGGAVGFIQNIVPSDIEIRGNHFYKPLSWKQDDPSYAGEAWTIKNILEFKNGRRVLIEGNLFDQSLRQYAVLFTVRTENGRMLWNVVEDITFRNNWVRHAGGGINILAVDNLDPASGGSVQRILVASNVFEDIDKAWDGSGFCFLILQGPGDVAIDHNTMLQSSSVLFADGTRPAAGFAFTNNITSGDLGGSGKGVGAAALDFYFPGAAVLRNVFAKARASSYPAGNFFPADLAAAGFADMANGDYRLAPGSSYRAKGTDGKNLGADIDRVEESAAAALTGSSRPVQGRRTLRPEPPRQGR